MCCIRLALWLRWLLWYGTLRGRSIALAGAISRTGETHSAEELLLMRCLSADYILAAIETF